MPISFLNALFARVTPRTVLREGFLYLKSFI
jgi:hypothetical protein